jgi:hypothetical protein
LVQIKRPPLAENIIDINPIFYNLNPEDIAFRIYTKKFQPLKFRESGPLARFDHHNGISNRGVYYAVPLVSSQYDALATCIVDIYMNINSIERLTNFNICSVKTNHTLKLLDLRGSGSMSAGISSAISFVNDPEITQEWSRFFYEREELYTRIDGLIYSSIYNQEPIVVFYDRAFDSLELVMDLPLVDFMVHKDFHEDICKILNDFQLVISPSYDVNLSGHSDINDDIPLKPKHQTLVSSGIGDARNNSENGNFDFLDRCIATAVNNAQQELLKKDIGYIYSREDRLIEYKPDGSEEQIQYLLDRDSDTQLYNTCTET